MKAFKEILGNIARVFIFLIAILTIVTGAVGAVIVGFSIHAVFGILALILVISVCMGLLIYFDDKV